MISINYIKPDIGRTTYKPKPNVFNKQIYTADPEEVRITFRDRKKIV